MKEAEYLRLKRAAQIDYQKKIEAIETVWKMSSGPSQKGKKSSLSKSGGLTDSVRKAIDTFDNQFTIKDVEREVKNINPSLTIRLPSIATVIIRLLQNSEIQKVSQGSGRQPSVYVKPKLKVIG